MPNARYELRLWAVLPRTTPARFAPDARGHLTLVGTRRVYGASSGTYQRIWHRGWRALSYTIGHMQTPPRWFLFRWHASADGNALSVISAFSIVAYDQKDGQPNYEHFTHIRSMWAPSAEENEEM